MCSHKLYQILSISKNVPCFVLLITGNFKVLYYTGQKRSGFKVFRLKSASLLVYLMALCKINAGYNTWVFTFSEILSFFFFFFFFSSFCLAFFSFI